MAPCEKSPTYFVFLKNHSGNRTFSLRRALNFLRQSTVSCLCTTDATRSRCCGNKRSSFLILLYEEIRHARVRLENWKSERVVVQLETYADPWVLEGLGGGDPLGGVHSQHLVDEVLGLRGHGVPLGRRILKLNSTRINCIINTRNLMRNSRHRHRL
jgi:hypothetical protein